MAEFDKSYWEDHRSPVPQAGSGSSPCNRVT